MLVLSAKTIGIYVDVGWGQPREHYEPIEILDGMISKMVNGTFR